MVQKRGTKAMNYIYEISQNQSFSENGNPLLYVMKMSLHRGWVVLKSLKIPLHSIKTAPYHVNENYFTL